MKSEYKTEELVSTFFPISLVLVLFVGLFSFLINKGLAFLLLFIVFLAPVLLIIKKKSRVTFLLPFIQLYVVTFVFILSRGIAFFYEVFEIGLVKKC